MGRTGPSPYAREHLVLDLCNTTTVVAASPSITGVVGEAAVTLLPPYFPLYIVSPVSSVRASPS